MDTRSRHNHAYIIDDPVNKRFLLTGKCWCRKRFCGAN